jgi:hypothetical protein
MNSLNSALPLARRLYAAQTLQDQTLADELAEPPRAQELAIYLDYRRRQPGGLNAVEENLISHHSGNIGTSAMRGIGVVKSYTAEQALSVWCGIPGHLRDRLCEGEAWRLDLLREEMARFDKAEFADCDDDDPDQEIDRALRGDAERRLFDGNCTDDEAAWIKRHVVNRKSGNPFKVITHGDTILAATLANLTPQKFTELCLGTARQNLSSHLADIANGRAITFTLGPWYWWNVYDALIAEMDRWAETVIGGIAKTEIYRITCDPLDFAWYNKRAVRIDAFSRYGKSISGLTYCRAWPGRAAYLTVPWSNRQSHLIEEIGKLFGLQGFGRELEEAVELICQTFKIVLVMDEAQGLFPASFSKNTSPGRLNWVRLELIKHDVPIALLCTPQNYQQRESRFTKTTGFAVEQFNGCLAKFPRMPEKITFQELVAIGMTYLPGVKKAIIEEIAAAAKATGQYLTYFEHVALNAAWIAKNSGRAEITSEDIDLAIIEATPPDKRAAASAPRREEKPAKPSVIARKSKSSVAVLPIAAAPHSRSRAVAAPSLEASPRQTTPTILEPA